MDEFDIRIGPTEAVRLAQRIPEWLQQPHRAVGAPDNQPVLVAITEEALLSACRHAESSLDEIGGVLVGHAYQWGERTVVEVCAALRGDSMTTGRAHATFTVDTWAGLKLQQEQLFPDQMIVGWYHSHPRMGIFLSGMDLEIHEGFFSSSWHIALVLNGQGHRCGFFIWKDERIVPAPGFYCLDALDKQPRLSLQQARRNFTYAEVGDSSAVSVEESSPPEPITNTAQKPEVVSSQHETEASEPPTPPVMQETMRTALIGLFIIVALAWVRYRSRSWTSTR